VTATLRLPPPANPDELAYLGLPAGSTDCSIADIRSEVLIVDCFDMYCHACQSGAERVHRLFELVRERGLTNRIRFLGLGVGNTPLEAGLFKRKFEVPFPVFPDRSNALARQFGPVRLPALVVLRRAPVGWLLVQHHFGIPADPLAFLNHLLEDVRDLVPDLSNGPPQRTSQDCTTGRCPLPVVAEAPSEPHSL